MKPATTLFGHPVGLTVLFCTEVWERFAYLGMRAMLVLYMTEQLLLPGHVETLVLYPSLKQAVESVFGPLSVQAMSSQIYGLYTSLIYLTPLFGGLIADRFLGQRRAVFIGGVLMAAGEFTLASGAALFLPGLLLIILGNGFFKPNISSQVGGLYPPGDPRCDRAFSIFYVGINIGAAAAPIICGTIGEVFGWRYGFFIAGVGMVLGLLIFGFGGRYLPSDRQRDAAASEGTPLTIGDRNVVLMLIAVSALSMLFWAAYEQKGNILTLWVRDYTDRSFFGLFDLKVTWFQSGNAMLIVLLTPLVVRVWRHLGRRGREPGSVTKLAIGCCIMSGAYLVLTVAALGLQPGVRASWLWILPFLVFLTLGELCLSPIGLALVSKTAPVRIVSMMMGVWLLGHFAGNYVAGLLGQFWSAMPKSSYWLMLAAVPACGALGVLLLLRPLNRVVRIRVAAGQQT